MNARMLVFTSSLSLLNDPSTFSADLVKAVPDEHKKFLANLVWVHEEVHALSFHLAY